MSFFQLVKNRDKTMHVLLNTVVLAISLLLIFRIKMIDITTTNFLFHKFAIFGVIYGLQLAFEATSRVVKGCKMIVSKMGDTALKSSLFGIVGYSLYIDIMLMSVRDTLKGISKVTLTHYAIVTSSIVVMIFLYYVSWMIIKNKGIDCDDD